MAMQIRDYPNVALEVMDLKDYIIAQLIHQSRERIFGETAYMDYYCRPHWKKNLKKTLWKADFILSLARPSSVEYFLHKAIEHFEKNSRHRAFNIMLDDVYVGCLKARNGKDFENKNHYRFHYYLAIRIQKRRFKIKGKVYKVLGYMATVDKMSKMGSIVHVHIGHGENSSIKPWGRSLLV